MENGLGNRMTRCMRMGFIGFIGDENGVWDFNNGLLYG